MFALTHMSDPLSITALNVPDAGARVLNKRAAQLRESARILAGRLRSIHPRNTVAHVSADTGVPMKTVERWFSATPAAPSFLHAVALDRAYPGILRGSVTARAEAVERQLAVIMNEIAELKERRDADTPERIADRSQSDRGHLCPLAR